MSVMALEGKWWKRYSRRRIIGESYGMDKAINRV